MHGTLRLFPVFISPIAWNMCEHLHYDSVHFKELHKEQEYYTAISRKVVGKMRATIPKGNMRYDQHTVPHDCSYRTYFCCCPLTLANICPWPLVPFFQFSLENRVDKATHNTFRDCRVHFFRQPFSKQLYIERGQL